MNVCNKKKESGDDLCNMEMCNAMCMFGHGYYMDGFICCHEWRSCLMGTLDLVNSCVFSVCLYSALLND